MIYIVVLICSGFPDTGKRKQKLVSGFPDRNRQQQITFIDYLKQISLGLSVCGTRAALKS